MNTYLKLVDNKNTLSFLNWGIQDLVENGKDCFLLSRLCFAWSEDTGLAAYKFRSALEAHIIA